MKAVPLAVVVSLLAVAAVGAWFAGEMHYENCVEAAEATHPVTSVEREDPNPIVRDYERFQGKQPKTKYVGLEQRQAAVEDCSRWPL